MKDSVRRILAIFRKDSRHLWPHALVFAALLVFAAVYDPTYTDQRSTGYYFYLQSVALPLACWSLIALAVHENRLVGDRQYWLGRPYVRWELFAAKALFVAAFVQLPILLQQAAILTAVGIRPGGEWLVLLRNQVTIGVFLILPAAALAAVTRSLAQMMLGALLVLVAFAWFLFGGPVRIFGSPGLLATPGSALIVTLSAGVILLLQYAGRRTSWARVAAAAMVILLLGGAFREQSKAVERWRAPLDWRDDVRIRFDPSRRIARTSLPRRWEPVRIELPIRIEGIPPGVEIGSDQMTVGLRGPGIPMGSGANRAPGIRIDADGQAWQTVYIKPDDFESVGESPVDLFGAMQLTLFRDRRTLAFPQGAPVSVPGVGVCSHNLIARTGNVYFTCLSPQPRASVQFESASGESTWIVRPSMLPGGTLRPGVPFYGGYWAMQAALPFSTRPFAGFRGVSVLDRFYGHPEGDGDVASGGTLIVRSTIDHFRVAFNFYSVRLRDYVASR